MITRTGGDMLERRTAIFSDCERYRYLLKIVWDDSKSLCQFIGLNPSTADEMKDDPTLRRCKDFARRWGHGGLLMTNLFAYRATLPKDMKAAKFPVSWCGFKDNDDAIFEAGNSAAVIVCAWGVDGAFLGRGTAVKESMQRLGDLLHYFKLCENGEPYHPLYMAAKTPLQVFK